MGLIEDYEKLVTSIRNLSKEVPEWQKQISALRATIEQETKKRAMLELDKTRRMDSLMREQLANLTSEEYTKISHAQAAVDNQIQQLTAKYNADCNLINSNIYRDKLSEQYALLAKIQQTIKACPPTTEASPELLSIVAQELSKDNQKYSKAVLLDLVDEVMESASTIHASTSSSAQIFDKVADYLAMRNISKSKLSNRSKFYTYIGYLAVLTALCIFVPVVPITLLSTSAVFSYKKCIDENKQLLNYILPYSKLQAAATSLSQQITRKVANLRSKDLDKLKSTYEHGLAPLEAQKAQLQLDFEEAPQKVRDKVSNADLMNAVESQFSSQLDESVNITTNAENEIEKLKKFIENNNAKLPGLKEKQKSLLIQISEAYLNPKTAGTSRTLTKSFFLGVDDKQGSLIEFKYDGQTTIIIYKGDTCRVNHSLISMMLMQIMSSMSMNSLDIYLVDLQSAGTDYAVFFRKKLLERMHLCTSTTDVKDAIETLQEVLALRTQEILTEAESLEVYNERMLANRSLPREYIFFFLQDPTKDQMESQALQQLLYNGPTVGIIPIIFISHAEINSISETDKDVIDNLSYFFKSFKDYYFVFDGKTNDLTQRPELCAAILSRLQKGLR